MILEKIIQRIKHNTKRFLAAFGLRKSSQIIDSSNEILRERALYITNNGERFDPELAPWLWEDKNHLPRYEFAMKYAMPDATVLDIACGTGYGTKMLASVSKKAIGVDISETAITYAKKKNKVKNNDFFVNDFYENTYTADLVVSFETIEHIKSDNFSDILTKLVSCANKRVIGSVPYLEKTGNNYHHHTFGIDESMFECLSKTGEVTFYYQDTEGVIRNNGTLKINVQNLIFMFDRKV